MLQWALVFLVVAIIAMVLGMGSVAGMSMQIAWILFTVFIILFVISLIYHLATGRKLPGPPV